MHTKPGNKLKIINLISVESWSYNMEKKTEVAKKTAEAGENLPKSKRKWYRKDNDISFPQVIFSSSCLKLCLIVMFNTRLTNLVVFAGN